MKRKAGVRAKFRPPGEQTAVGCSHLWVALDTARLSQPAVKPFRIVGRHEVARGRCVDAVVAIGGRIGDPAPDLDTRFDNGNVKGRLRPPAQGDSHRSSGETATDHDDCCHGTSHPLLFTGHELRHVSGEVLPVVVVGVEVPHVLVAGEFLHPPAYRCKSAGYLTPYRRPTPIGTVMEISSSLGSRWTPIGVNEASYRSG